MQNEITNAEVTNAERVTNAEQSQMNEVTNAERNTVRAGETFVPYDT